MAIYNEYTNKMLIELIGRGQYKIPGNVQRWMDEHRNKIPLGNYLAANSTLRCIQVYNDQGEIVFNIDYEGIEYANNYYIMETLRHISYRYYI